MENCKECQVKVRGFEVVKTAHRKHAQWAVAIPARKTEQSAAYDFASLETYTIQPGEVHHFATDIKAYMMPNEVLILNVRSSIGCKKHCMLVNTQGWIDSDFYNNPENDGNIGIGLKNCGEEPVTIEFGERIAQGCFVKYLVKDNDADDRKAVRVGGIGSTGTK